MLDWIWCSLVGHKWKCVGHCQMKTLVGTKDAVGYRCMRCLKFQGLEAGGRNEIAVTPIGD